MFLNHKPNHFSHFFAYEIVLCYDYNNHNEIYHINLDKLVKKYKGISIEEDSMPYFNNRTLDKLFYKFPYNNSNLINFLENIKEIDYPYEIYEINILYKTIENCIEKYTLTKDNNILFNDDWLLDDDKLLYNYIIK
jgi:hypothetical protein